MTQKILALLVLFAVTLFGCLEYTEITQENYLFVGEWIAPGQTLTIYSRGAADYEGTDGAATTTLSGVPVTITNDKLTLEFVVKKEFSITKRPYTNPETQELKMELDGVVFVKQNNK
ncbi:MAG: hypothetical protein J4215_06305 [Candidatus Diapherotrites archaeon]|uniref:Lipoprotein n=1 Tax=Candidatus Iainarchaeum sp. TaxID=3101447 RepID=A0A8T4L4A5_9ARCH|nr:hypothetical protein [Candidatus Diapherotrites archaeon]